MKKQARVPFFAVIIASLFAYPPLSGAEPAPETAGTVEPIKAYCLDFNWAATHRRRRPFARPGAWASADPAKHVAWYKAVGANVIQTFCVSCNGYAWYKNGYVPEQPGLQNDFLPEVVKLGHAEGMLVMGYFCIAANAKWGKDHPDLSYGAPTSYHIPYTDEYLEYLTKSIHDAVSKTGIDGFMIDWLWMPNRRSTGGKWLECEKKLYQQIMGTPFPGEDKLTKAQDTVYSRKAIDRCWKAIHKAAKDTNPNCIIWVTVNKINHPHVVNSDMYKEADWLMNEAGSLKGINAIKGMVGEHTRLITCMARWNGQDAARAVPEALDAGVGLYGFTAPTTRDGLVPLDKIFARQVSELTGDSRSIAVLARAYRGKSIHAVWKDGQFVEPDTPPPFDIALKGRGRGIQDTASVAYDKDSATVMVTTPYARGRAQLVRTGDAWPASLTILLQKRPGQPVSVKCLKIANGTIGMQTTLSEDNKGVMGEVDAALDLGREWRDKFSVKGGREVTLIVKKTEDSIGIVVPSELTTDNPRTLAFEWN